MVTFVDTHAHLDQEELRDSLSEVIERARHAGLKAIIAIGTTADSSAKCIELASRYDDVFAAVGIQPNYVAEAAAGDWERIVDLAARPKVVAIGETGLDRYWDYTPFDQQQDFFDRHIELAHEKRLPFVVHTRESEEDVLEALRVAHGKYGPLRGVMHSFAGSGAAAAECVKLGLHISFAGMVTFKKSAELRQVAKHVPADRILIETDSPYLSPEPKRGKFPNEPARVVHIAERLAEVREISLEEFAAQTTANAERLFDLR